MTVLKKAAGRERVPAGEKDGGFTLVELIVAMVIVVPLLAAIIGLFVFGSNVFVRTSDRFVAKQMAAVILQRIQNNVEYADAVTIYADKAALPLDSSRNYLYLSDGSYVQGRGAAEDYRLPAGTGGAYGGFVCEKLTFTKQSPRTITVHVEIAKAGEKLFGTDISVYINNMLSGSVEGAAGSALEYTDP